MLEMFRTVGIFIFFFSCFFVEIQRRSSNVSFRSTRSANADSVFCSLFLHFSPAVLLPPPAARSRVCRLSGVSMTLRRRIEPVHVALPPPLVTDEHVRLLRASNRRNFSVVHGYPVPDAPVGEYVAFVTANRRRPSEFAIVLFARKRPDLNLAPRSTRD